MALTDTDAVHEIDEALTHVNASHLVARAAGDLKTQLRLAEHIDELLEHRLEVSGQKNPDSNVSSVETCQPLSPRRRSDFSGAPS